MMPSPGTPLRRPDSTHTHYSAQLKTIEAVAEVGSQAFQTKDPKCSSKSVEDGRPEESKREL